MINILAGFVPIFIPMVHSSGGSGNGSAMSSHEALHIIGLMLFWSTLWLVGAVASVIFGEKYFDNLYSGGIAIVLYLLLTAGALCYFF